MCPICQRERIFSGRWRLQDLSCSRSSLAGEVAVRAARFRRWGGRIPENREFVGVRYALLFHLGRRRAFMVVVAVRPAFEALRGEPRAAIPWLWPDVVFRNMSILRPRLSEVSVIEVLPFI